MERSEAELKIERRADSCQKYKKNMSKIVPEVTLSFTEEMNFGEEIDKLLTYTE